jgi:hypothetical protein
LGVETDVADGQTTHDAQVTLAVGGALVSAMKRLMPIT